MGLGDQDSYDKCEQNSKNVETCLLVEYWQAGILQHNLQSLQGKAKTKCTIG